MKILLIADVHNKPHGSRSTLLKIKKVTENAEYDLIVFLGDTVHGPSTPNNYEKYLRQVLDLTNGRPFATVFGNHDDECKTTKNEILSVLKSYPNCKTDGRDYILNMHGETLLFLDSGSYYDGDGSFYDVLKPEQIAFAKSQISGKKAILFQHIILPDIMDLIDEYDVKMPNSVKDGKKYYKFKTGIEYTGKLGECPCPPLINTGALDELKDNLKACVFGHDHKNSFETYVKGVKFIQCAGSGSNSYDKFCKSSVKILDTATLETRQIFL
ncbi:MAG: metallophosphoesterase [Clostridiales bacterium]|nr:metallophosphoesterase [Clostridiales bacterium]